MSSCKAVADMQWQQVLLPGVTEAGMRRFCPPKEPLLPDSFVHIGIGAGLQQPVLKGFIHRSRFACIGCSKRLHIVKRKTGANKQDVVETQCSKGSTYLNVATKMLLSFGLDSQESQSGGVGSEPKIVLFV